MSNEWRKARLGDICSFKYGQMPKKSDLAGNGFPVFSGYRIVGYSKKYHYKDPEIIVVARGIGGTGDVKMTPPSCFLTNLSIAVLVDSPSIEKRFLFYQLLSTTLWELRTGSAQAQITIERLKGHEVLIPPIATQRRITSILSTYDDLIENNTRRIATLEEMVRALYREWFVEFRFPGHEKVRMIETGSTSCPEGWILRPLGKLVHELRDTVDPKSIDANTPYVGLEHLPRRSTTLVEWGASGDVGSTKLRFQSGDILFGKIRPYFHKVAVASFDGVSSSDAIVMRPIDLELRGLILGCVSSDEFVGHATQTSNGTKMPRANWSVLKEYPVPIPPKTILRSFVRTVNAAVEQAQNLAAKNRNLRTTRDLLLPRLVSGEIDVSLPSEPHTGAVSA